MSKLPTPLEKSSDVVTGPQVCVLVHSVYVSYHDETVNQCVIQELLRRIRICGSAHHIIGGDFQALAQNALFREHLVTQGWISSAYVSNHEPTNFPPVGEARPLHDLLCSPNLACAWQSCQVQKLLGFSTHGAVCCDFEVPDAHATQVRRLERTVTAKHIEEALEQVNSQDGIMWQYEERVNDAQAQYNQWLEALHSWIGLPPGTFGEMGVKIHDKKTGKLMAPLKARKLIIQNLLRKANAWGELAAIYPILNMDRHGECIRLLVQALQRMPWSKWDIEPPPVSHIDMDWESFVWWKTHCWSQAYQVADQLAGQKLHEWRDAMRLAAAGHHMGKLSKWLGGASPPTALWVEDKAIVDPDDFVTTMHKEWSTIL